ncbi:MAG TPA: MOSC domain-containing protein [Chitinophagaceae bacterium]|nr:MOSC domain-containing protein [Chitinophagaceae bacterium]
MLTVSELFIYPIKSLGGISVASATVTEKGFEYDRGWMLVDENNIFMTQRELPAMALLQVMLADNGLNVQHKHNHASITIPYQPQTNAMMMVQVWEDFCMAQLVSKEADEWFSEMLSISCRLVYMPADTKRTVDINYAFNNETTSFSDGFPFLLIGQSSLDELNSRMREPLPINRFRPNIVFTGGHAFEEDELAHFTINDINFYAVKPCARCPITATNQQTAERGKEPLLALSKFRRREYNVYFGQNLLHKGDGKIRVGDAIEVLERKEAMRF